VSTAVTPAVLALVNQARAGAGCDALTEDPDLTALAGQHVADMAERGDLDLAGLGGRGAVVARGPADTGSAVAGWLADDGDSARLLDCGVTTAGAAEASGDGGPWWTLALA
jgi:uncharacterized protein YkwD